MRNKIIQFKINFAVNRPRITYLLFQLFLCLFFQKIKWKSLCSGSHWNTNCGRCDPITRMGDILAIKRQTWLSRDSSSWWPEEYPEF